MSNAFSEFKQQSEEMNKLHIKKMDRVICPKCHLSFLRRGFSIRLWRRVRRCPDCRRAFVPWGEISLGAILNALAHKKAVGFPADGDTKLLEVIVA